MGNSDSTDRKLVNRVSVGLGRNQDRCDEEKVRSTSTPPTANTALVPRKAELGTLQLTSYSPSARIIRYRHALSVKNAAGNGAYPS